MIEVEPGVYSILLEDGAVYEARVDGTHCNHRRTNATRSRS